MLQAWEFEIEVKINNRDWEGTSFTGWNLKEKVPETYEAIVENLSFEDFYKHQLKEMIPGFTLDETFFRKRKSIFYRARWNIEGERFFEKDVQSISIRYHNYTKKVSLKEIFEHCTADKAIQYLKERGLTICPYGVEK